MMSDPSAEIAGGAVPPLPLLRTTSGTPATALAMAARRRETSAWRVVTAGFTLDASRASAVCCSSIELWRDVTEALSVETVAARPAVWLWSSVMFSGCPGASNQPVGDVLGATVGENVPQRSIETLDRELQPDTLSQSAF